jgi:hypothetical protein
MNAGLASLAAPSSLMHHPLDPLAEVQAAINRFKDATRASNGGKLNRFELSSFACVELSKAGQSISGRKVHELIGYGRSNDVCADVHLWQTQTARTVQAGVAPGGLPEDARVACEDAFSSIYRSAMSVANLALQQERVEVQNLAVRARHEADQALEKQRLAENRLDDSLKREATLQGRLDQLQKDCEGLQSQLAGASAVEAELRGQISTGTAALEAERVNHEQTRAQAKAELEAANGRIDAGIRELDGVRKHILLLQDQQAETTRAKDATIADMKARLQLADERQMRWGHEREQLVIARTNAETELAAQNKASAKELAEMRVALKTYQDKDALFQRQQMEHLVNQTRQHIRQAALGDPAVFEIVDLVDGAITFDETAAAGEVGSFWLEDCDGRRLSPMFPGQDGAKMLIEHVTANLLAYQALAEAIGEGENVEPRLAALTKAS